MEVAGIYTARGVVSGCFVLKNIAGDGVDPSIKVRAKDLLGTMQARIRVSAD